MKQFHSGQQLPKKFFLISQVFYPDEVSTANLFTNLAINISKNGVQVEVWAAQPSYTHSTKQASVINHEGIIIKYLPSTRFHKSNFAGRVLNIITFMLSSCIKLILSKDKAPVFTHTTPPTLGLFISIICVLKKRKFVYILLDIFPEGLIRLKKLRNNNLFVRFWKRIFRNSLKRSSSIIVLGRDMLEYIGLISPESVKKIEYIPLWQDESLIRPIELRENKFFMELGLNQYFVVQYSGNMGLWNDMELIGQAVNENMKDVFFLFIGDGMRKRELRNIISDTNNKYLFLPFQPTELLGTVLTACHAAIVSLRDGMEGMAVPSKIYGILAAGKPVLAIVPENSEIAYIVNEEKCGLVIQPDDYNGLIDAINLLKSDDKLRTSMGKNGRKAFELKYSTKVITEKYLSLINQLS